MAPFRKFVNLVLTAGLGSVILLALPSTALASTGQGLGTSSRHFSQEILGSESPNGKVAVNPNFHGQSVFKVNLIPGRWVYGRAVLETEKGGIVVEVKYDPKAWLWDYEISVRGPAGRYWFEDESGDVYTLIIAPTTINMESASDLHTVFYNSKSPTIKEITYDPSFI